MEQADQVLDNLFARFQRVREEDVNQRIVPKDWQSEMEWRAEQPCEVVCVCGPVFVCDPVTHAWRAL